MLVSKFSQSLSVLTSCADQEWGVICQNYQDELAGLRVLRRNVTQTLSKLRIETEKLQREDEVIRDQEEKLRQGYEQLEQKHGQYRTKGENCDPLFHTRSDSCFVSQSCFGRNRASFGSLWYKTGRGTPKFLRYPFIRYLELPCQAFIACIYPLDIHDTRVLYYCISLLQSVFPCGRYNP